jgi:hypothetical protein
VFGMGTGVSPPPCATWNLFIHSLAILPSEQGVCHISHRPISTTRLNTLLCVHLWPINLLVSEGPIGRPCLEAGFVLRCLQLLSEPDLATQRCPWRDNWYTIGPAISVLSY